MYWPNSADDNLFVDDDGAAYIVHTARSTGTKIVVERLTPDYTASAGATDPAARSGLIGPGHTEAPALFKYGGRYYVTFAQLCCYCTEGKEPRPSSAPSPLRYVCLATHSSSSLVCARHVIQVRPRWSTSPTPPSAPTRCSQA